MARTPSDNHPHQRYDDNETVGDTNSIPTISPTTPNVVPRKARPTPDAHLTLEVMWATGPEADSLAREQYDAIREVLHWTHTTSKDAA